MTCSLSINKYKNGNLFECFSVFFLTTYVSFQSVVDNVICFVILQYKSICSNNIHYLWIFKQQYYIYLSCYNIIRDLIISSKLPLRLNLNMPEIFVGFYLKLLLELECRITYFFIASSSSHNSQKIHKHKYRRIRTPHFCLFFDFSWWFLFWIYCMI